jgi:RNA polymerase sigma-70 factor (ECF subfamily)
MNPGLDQKESRMILNRALNALPRQQRTAFILHKCEDLPQKEIAAVMNVSISAVESLIYRAKIQLRRKLNFYFPEYIK